MTARPLSPSFWRSRWGVLWLGGLALYWPFGPEGASLPYNLLITVLTATVFVVWLWLLTAAYNRVTGWVGES